MKTINEVLREGNSTTNQNIKSRFINQHVLCNVNTMTEFIISRSYEGDDNTPFTFEDIENYYSYPEYNGKHVQFGGGTEEDRSNELEAAKELLNTFEEQEKEEEASELENEIQELEDLESEAQEVFEWWKVSNYLLEKLKALGHPVIEEENIWGRCTTGQAILLDYSITQISAEMEILEGQPNSWKA